MASSRPACEGKRNETNTQLETHSRRRQNQHEVQDRITSSRRSALSHRSNDTLGQEIEKTPEKHDIQIVVAFLVISLGCNIFSTLLGRHQQHQLRVRVVELVVLIGLLGCAFFEWNSTEASWIMIVGVVLLSYPLGKRINTLSPV